MIFMNSENSKTFDVHRLRLYITDKVDLWRGDNCVALSTCSICYTWKSIKKLYRNNKFKISGTTWDKQFDLFEQFYSYAISDIQIYFEYILQKHETLTDNLEKEKYKIRLIHVLFYFHKISDVSPFTKGIVKLL